MRSHDVSKTLKHVKGESSWRRLRPDALWRGNTSNAIRERRHESPSHNIAPTTFGIRRARVSETSQERSDEETSRYLDRRLGLGGASARMLLVFLGLALRALPLRPVHGAGRGTEAVQRRRIRHDDVTLSSRAKSATSSPPSTSPCPASASTALGTTRGPRHCVCGSDLCMCECLCFCVYLRVCVYVCVCMSSQC